ncbi:MAG: TraR/DksA family transcriptional regulator [Minisyncoccia bacterium]
MLTTEQIAKCKSLLLQEKNNIENKIINLNENINFANDSDKIEGEEFIDETEEKINRNSVEEIELDRLQLINKALDKIQKGTYGICEKCGQDIEYDILSIDPESLYCKNCKQK